MIFFAMYLILWLNSIFLWISDSYPVTNHHSSKKTCQTPTQELLFKYHDCYMYETTDQASCLAYHQGWIGCLDNAKYCGCVDGFSGWSSAAGATMNSSFAALACVAATISAGNHTVAANSNTGVGTNGIDTNGGGTKDGGTNGAAPSISGAFNIMPSSYYIIIIHWAIHLWWICIFDLWIGMYLYL